MANMLQKICHGCRDWTVSADCSMVTVVTAVSQLSGVVLEVAGISAPEVGGVAGGLSREQSRDWSQSALTISGDCSRWQ